jgi:hypothetical protein
MGRRILALLGAVTALSAVALPAAQAANTTTTFTLTGGSLSVTAPASVNLGTGSAGDSAFTGQLGTVTVDDLRGGLLASWAASASTGDFTTGGATANETIEKAKVSYWSGAATASSGVGVFLPGQLTALLKVILGTAQTAFSASATVGNNSTSWNPTIVVDASSAVAGTYSGTVTHSVA